MSDDKTPSEIVEDAVADDAAIAAKGGIGWLSLVVAVLFGLPWAYLVYQAIGNLIELPKSYTTNGLGDSVPWLLLVIGLLIPIALYVLSFIIGLRRNALDKAVIFLMGLAVTAALSYAVVAVHRLTFIDLLTSLTK